MMARMIYCFGPFELDTDRVELRSDGAAVAVEPQVFALLRLLLENRERMVSRDEIIAKVWNGRIVSDSAIASRIKSARQAVGDDGRAQAVIRTVHGQGFAFVADVATRSTVIITAAESGAPLDIVRPQNTRPGVAVLPFRVVGASEPGLPIAEALPHDLIVELSRLHWLRVIARGSSFRFRDETVDLGDVSAKLGVQYCLTGSVQILGGIMLVSVELSDTKDKGIVWSESFRESVGAVHEIREQIIKAVSSAVEIRVPLHEARRAQLKSPENLDAWSSYHLGLHHMYRFNKADNETATSLFERAISLEPDFARAYAGLSFTHFQTAFLRYGDQAKSADLAQTCSAQCLERDPLDPFGHFTMGRAQWLRGDLEGGVAWLERATMLNPNYAQARYSRGWAEALLGDATASRVNIDDAMALSPLDPLLYAMLAVNALSYLGRDDAEQASRWADQAAHAPGAHALINMIAAVSHDLRGDRERAAVWARSVRERAGHLGKADFLRSFPFRDPPTRARILASLERMGF